LNFINYLLRWLRLLPVHGNRDVFPFMDSDNYTNWFMQFDSFTREDRETLLRALEGGLQKPKIGIVPLSAQPLKKAQLRKFGQCLSEQIYGNWKLIHDASGADDGADIPGSRPAAQMLIDAARDTDFVLPLPVDAVLRPHTLAMFVLALCSRPETEIIYADEDTMRNGRRCEPHFKTDWDPFFILGCNYTGLPILFRSEALLRAKLHAVSSRTIDNFIHAVTLRTSRVSSAERILHIPSILCHRKSPSDWSVEEAVSLASQDDGLSNEITISADPRIAFGNRVGFALPEPNPLVSILIPTRDHSEVVARCMDGLLRGTNYPALEIIIMDNGTTEMAALDLFAEWKSHSNVRVIRDDRPFNYSQLNNGAAKAAKGEILVLLNNDIEILHPDWLQELVSPLFQPGVGIAGAKLLYPDFRVQHAGITFGANDAVLHEMQLASRFDPGLLGALSLVRSVSAVTGACLAIGRALYWQAGGLDEEFKVAFNDVDLCRRVAEMGYSIVWTPFAELIHHECLSRGPLSDPQTHDRELSEQMRFWSKHSAFYENQDPFHNPQIEFRGRVVDFARPPRPHPLRDLACDKPHRAFVY